MPVLLVTEDGGHGGCSRASDVRAHSWRVLRSNRDVATFLLANTAWEGTFAGARRSSSSTSPPVSGAAGHLDAILGAVAAGYIVAALVAGRIGDRVGLRA